MRSHLKVRSHGNLLGPRFFLVQNRAKKLDFSQKVVLRPGRDARSSCGGQRATSRVLTRRRAATGVSQRRALIRTARWRCTAWLVGRPPGLTPAPSVEVALGRCSSIERHDPRLSHCTTWRLSRELVSRRRALAQRLALIRRAKARLRKPGSMGRSMGCVDASLARSASVSLATRRAGSSNWHQSRLS